MGEHHPAIEEKLSWLEYGHLPPHLQETSKLFHDLAHKLADSIPSSPQLTIALQRIIDAKDAAVRASIPKK